MSDNAGYLMRSAGRVFPAWFRLKFLESGTLVFLVRDSVLGWFDEIASSNFGSAQGYLNDLSLSSFELPNDSLWGYEQTIRTVESNEPNWVRYEIDYLPSVTNDDHSWFAIAASISILAQALSLISVKYVESTSLAAGTLPQLLTFQSYVSKEGMAGVPLEAFYSRSIAQWVSQQQSHDNLSEVVEGMQQAYERLCSEESVKDYASPFETRIDQPCYLTIDIGSRVGLIVDGAKRKDSDIETGYRVHMHNPDSVVWQLVLIAGLAKLYEVIEYEL